MSQLVPIRRALISVSDKTDLVPFARALAARGVELVSTGGTAATLAAAGIDVINIADVTGFPEMMDGRVKTLHPAIHGALLGRRDQPSHMASMQEHGFVPIDLVCVNLYPFERTIRTPDVAPEDAIEQIDIGGPAILRSAAKNHADVTVITAVTQYDRVINELKANDGATTLELRRDLAAAAFSRTAEYDSAISAWMSHRREQVFPPTLRLSYVQQFDLRYGENPHQDAALYANPASRDASVVRARLLQGKPLSYNNIHDGAAALEVVRDLGTIFPDRAAATVIKHTNPCGAAVATTLHEAFERAYDGDPLAAYGGILATSRPIDVATATAICAGTKFLEVIIAPEIDPAAAEMIAARWTNARVLAVGPLNGADGMHLDYKSIPGGMLVQHRDTRIGDGRDWQHAAGPAPSDDVLRDALFANVIAKHLKSNAIAVARGGRLLGGGPGQVDRVSSCHIAIAKAGDRIGPGTVAASDAFFPFPDGPALLIDAGVTCIVQPGGSKRDPETFALCDERGVTCLTTGIRHFRH
ncbi:MAG: bifunctional phosphoribosylaminoimidazolecarboxamide formyltransferase/IMP cyclohydrolase [Phycisphaerales bacterium]|nr:bifunctional phosphoribosylaminoimidazolecarboxamide formyltransferase/IMP cyclohydrolase [Phycisphaerales bacterium]